MSPARRSIRRRDWPRGLYEVRKGYFVWREPGVNGKQHTLGAMPYAQARHEALMANEVLLRRQPTLVDRLQGGTHTVKDLLADMQAAVLSGRAMYLHAARLRDAGRDFSTEAAAAKLVCTDAAMRWGHDCAAPGDPPAPSMTATIDGAFVAGNIGAAAEFERRLAGLRAEGVPTEGRCECGISFAAGLNGRLFGEVIGPGPQDPEVNCVHVVPMHDASFAHCYDEEDFEEEWADAVTETLSTEHALP